MPAVRARLRRAVRKIPPRLRPALKAAPIALCAFLALYLMLASVVPPERYALRAGQRAPVTFTASKDIDDAVTTEELRQRAVAEVAERYRPDDAASDRAIARIAGALDRLDGARLTLADDDRELRQMYTTIQIETLRAANADQFHRFAADLTDCVRQRLGAWVQEGREREAIDAILRDLEGREGGAGWAEIARTLLIANFEPNLLLDAEATERARADAYAAVPIETYRMGQTIVREGEIVTRAQFEVLDKLGIIKNRAVDLSLYLGIGLILLLMMAIPAMYLAQFDRGATKNLGQLTLMCAIAILTLALSLLFRPLRVELMPVSLGVMLAALLIKPRTALILNLPISIVAGFVGASGRAAPPAAMTGVILSGIVSGAVCAAVIARQRHRVGVMIAGLLTGAANVATHYAVGLIINANIAADPTWIPWAAGSGVLAAVICIGSQPALEWFFNLATPSKLAELSNPNQPLIRRLLLEAPGTYHHSIIVANLSEAAANAVGANALLARVGAYYHDAGKLMRPMYFTENQSGDNPHDRTDTQVSVAILTAHPRDGAQLAQKQRIPRPILDIIAQHHGDSPVSFFYERALARGEGPLNPDDFRYDDPKPQTVEAAIVMLADTVEAATRSLGDSDPKRIGEAVGRLVRAKLDDGQLDDSPITLRDLSRIVEAFSLALAGAFHRRVAYPAVSLERRRRAGPRAAAALPLPDLPDAPTPAKGGESP